MNIIDWKPNQPVDLTQDIELERDIFFHLMKYSEVGVMWNGMVCQNTIVLNHKIASIRIILSPAELVFYNTLSYRTMGRDDVFRYLTLNGAHENMALSIAEAEHALRNEVQKFRIGSAN